MNCDEALDLACDVEDLQRSGSMDEAPSLGRRFLLALHILSCRGCAGRLERYAEARSFLAAAFFPPSPDLSGAVMDRIYREEEAAGEYDGEPVFDLPGGVSTRGWVIVGLVMIISLAAVFFGNDFASIALAQGSSYLLPLGIIIGVIITGYGALFIGSHLKELSERFKL